MNNRLAALSTFSSSARSQIRERLLGQDVVESERGDVPGWVMITLMTAGLVIALWTVAGTALTELFETAITRVLAQR